MSSFCAARVARIGQALLVVAASLVALSGCDWINNGMRWTEDVRLPDGRIITLDRYTEFNGKARTESFQKFSFTHPDTGKHVTWENLPKAGQLSTVALWIHNGKPRLLTTPLYGDAVHLRGCPNPPYLLFEHERNRWSGIPLADIGLGLIRANMTHHAKSQKDLIQHRPHRSASETAASYTFKNGTKRVPYLLDFRRAPTQTFGVECDRRDAIVDLLVETSE